jgi:hypothetical protein
MELKLMQELLPGCCNLQYNAAMRRVALVAMPCSSHSGTTRRLSQTDAVRWACTCCKVPGAPEAF